MTLSIVQLPLGPLQTNCYLMACTTTGQAAVVDPAWDGRAILAQATSHGWAISHILLTHSHFDHVGGLAELKELTGAPIYAHPDAGPMLARATAAAALWGFHVDAPPPADLSLAEVVYLTWRTRAALPADLPLFGAPRPQPFRP